MQEEMQDKKIPTKIVLIPAGLSKWDLEGRLQGDADIPLSEEGKASVLKWITQIGPLDIVYSAPSDPAKETAETIKQQLGCKVVYERALSALDLGLWEGMLVSDLQSRYPKVYKQWRENPESVKPPEGESVPELKERLNKVLAEILKEHKGKRVGIVLDSFGVAVFRQRFERKPIKESLSEERTWHEYVLMG